MNVCRRVEVQFPSLLNMALRRAEWSLSYPVRCSLEERTPKLNEQETEVEEQSRSGRVVRVPLYLTLTSLVLELQRCRGDVGGKVPPLFLVEGSRKEGRKPRDASLTGFATGRLGTPDSKNSKKKF
jgi:hypothetical protein